MMEKEELESLLIDYIDGNLNETDKVEVERILAIDDEARKRHDQLKFLLGTMDMSGPSEPSENLRRKFQDMLNAQSREQNRPRTILFPAWMAKVAAVLLLLIVGGGIGYWISEQHKRNEAMLALKRELEQMKQTVMTKLEDDQSPSQRILGVKAVNRAEMADDEIVNALIHVMNTDPNSNVRLSAINALAKFYDEKTVRRALITSLLKQTDPVVQIALIQLMIQMKEKDALNPLHRIIEDENVLPVVKDEAHAGIFKIS